MDFFFGAAASSAEMRSHFAANASKPCCRSARRDANMANNSEDGSSEAAAARAAFC